MTCTYCGTTHNQSTCPYCGQGRRSMAKKGMTPKQRGEKSRETIIKQAPKRKGARK